MDLFEENVTQDYRRDGRKTPLRFRAALGCLLAASLFALACASTAPRPTPQAATPAVPYVLRVALFPYIPDAANDQFKALMARMKSEFEAANPGIALDLMPMDPDADFYDLTNLSKWLGNSPASGGYQVVEADTVLLGDLVTQIKITPWQNPPNQSDWHPAALAASTYNGSIYGAPHYLCSYFLFSRDPSVTATRTIDDLLAALAKQTPPPPPQVPPIRIVGNLKGSWETGSFYLDSWSQTHGPANVAKAMSPDLDPGVIKPLQAFANDCRYYGVTPSVIPCTNGMFHDQPEKPYEIFGQGEATAAFGYSEELNTILNIPSKGNAVQMEIAPLGEGQAPLVFVDSLVLNHTCDASCQVAATAFASYLESSTTYEWLLLAQDAGPNAIPRYLTPATLSAYTSPGVSANPYYSVIKAGAANAAPYPNSGYPEVRKAMEKAILDAIGGPAK